MLENGALAKDVLRVKDAGGKINLMPLCYNF